MFDLVKAGPQQPDHRPWLRPISTRCRDYTKPSSLADPAATFEMLPYSRISEARLGQSGITPVMDAAD